MHAFPFARTTTIARWRYLLVCVSGAFALSACRSARSSSAAETFAPALVALGDSIFNNGSCYRCHGKQGVGTVNGPSFVGHAWQHGSGRLADIERTIISGVPLTEVKDPSHKLAMRARGGMQPLLTDAQVHAVAAYVQSIAKR